MPTNNNPENLRVLIAEDNPSNMKILSKILEKIGIDADLAKNGRATIEEFKKNNQQLIFMDCFMPEMDGFEACRIIRNETNNSNLPVIIAITADNMKENINECIKSGMNDYIIKPYRYSEIIEMLNKYFPSIIK